MGIPTWLAVTSTLDYEPVSAQAGPVWATARPEFAEAVWEMANGDIVRCRSDTARSWEPVTPDDPRCSYTYESTVAAPHRGRLTVRWTVRQLTDKSAGQWETWGTVAISAPIEWEVAQLQAAIR